jgi:hypothetical protein
MSRIKKIKEFIVIGIATVSILTLTTVLRDLQLGIGVIGLNSDNYALKSLISALIILSVLLNFQKRDPKILNQNISVIYTLATTLFYTIIFEDISISIIIGVITLLKLFSRYINFKIDRVIVLSLSLLSLFLLLQNYQFSITSNIILTGALIANMGISVLCDKADLTKNLIINSILTILLFLSCYLENSNIQLSYFLVIIVVQVSLFLKLLGDSLIFKLAIIGCLLPVLFMITNIPSFNPSGFDINFENLKKFSPNLSQLKIYIVVILTLLQLVMISRTRDFS